MASFAHPHARRRWYHGPYAHGKKSSVRFPAPPREAAPAKVIRDRGGVDCARQTANNYRRLAEQAGSTLARENYLRRAAEWDRRADEALARLRGPQQSAGELLRP